MFYPIVRLYENEQQARDAAGRLASEGFAESTIRVVTPPGEGGADTGALANAIAAGQLMGEDAATYAERVHAGRSLVVVGAPFGRSKLAAGLMDSCGPVDTDVRPPREPDPWGPGAPFSAAFHLPVLSESAAPLSRAAGLPTLVTGRTTFGELMSSYWTFSKWFGLPLLSKMGAPLSRMTGMPILTRSSGGMRSRIGFPLLINRAAPLSSSLGMPLLTRNAAPLSTLCSLPLLTHAR